MQQPTARERIENLWSRATPIGPLLDAYRDQVLTEAAAAKEGLRARLWLIEQTLTPIDVQQDPAGIVGMIGPILDGPLHPTDLAAYRAARGTQES
jgi:hypothetical protein